MHVETVLQMSVTALRRPQLTLACDKCFNNDFLFCYSFLVGPQTAAVVWALVELGQKLCWFMLGRPDFFGLNQSKDQSSTIKCSHLPLNAKGRRRTPTSMEEQYVGLFFTVGSNWVEFHWYQYRQLHFWYHDMSVNTQQDTWMSRPPLGQYQ